MKVLAIMVRILTLLFILQVATACENIEKMYESRNDDQLAKAKRWSTHHLPQIGVKCNLSTSWREGKMYYIFNAEPLIDPKEALNTESKPEEYVRKANQSRSFAHSLEYGSGLPSFTLRLTDNEGFQIMLLEMNEISRIVDNEGKSISLQEKSNIECSRKRYQDISNWEVQWRHSLY